MLEVQYQCLKLTTKTICPGQEVVLSCPSHKGVTVSEAWYGQPGDVGACWYGYTGCQSAAKSYVSSLCEGRSECVLSAENAEKAVQKSDLTTPLNDAYPEEEDCIQVNYVCN